MTKLTDAFCVFETLLPYLDLPDGTVYNEVESNGFRASAFSHLSENKITEKMCLSRRNGTFT
jgi:(2Fe-2S) ferredoxin